VEVLGDDGKHFEALIVSPQFTGKNKVQQHKLVYLALGGRMRSEIHALAMRTLTPRAWAQSAVK
jgi:acid stress-induced BolA-like protein IbaG/YrbA